MSSSSTTLHHSNHPRFILDPDGPLTHDLTTVDIVAVPCPGADAHRSWARDGLMSRYHGALSMRDAQRPGPSMSWVRHGIRRENNRARVLLYEHPDKETLSDLADALLSALRGLDRQRPLIFVAHSLGGLVVKMALVRARSDLLKHCYGVAFFGTPHQGSSYFAMPNLATSIQSLLQLTRPLPASITNDLLVGNPFLVNIDQQFKSVSQDLQIWTFYETINSRLSGGSLSFNAESRDVFFTAPLTSTKSAILGMRQERIFPLQSDHANVASFGRHNVQVLNVFLKQLAHQIDRADAHVRDGASGGHWQLGLEQKVNVEVHGFFSDSPSPPSSGRDRAVEEHPIIRAWSTRVPLRDFLKKGPEICLRERLNEVEVSVKPEVFLQRRVTKKAKRKHNLTKSAARPTPAASLDFSSRNNAPDLQDSMPDGTTLMPSPASHGIRSFDGMHPPHSAPATSPSDALTPRTQAIALLSSPMLAPTPLIRADFEQDLAVDRLSPSLRGRSVSLGSEGLRPEVRDFPAFSNHRPLGLDETLSDEEGIDSLPRLPEAIIAVRKPFEDGTGKRETVIVDGVKIAFRTPDVRDRKFVWIHVPFNNPAWVKSVFRTLETAHQEDYMTLYGQDFWMARHSRGRHAQHYAYFATPGCYYPAPQTLSPRQGSLSTQSQPLAARGADSMFTCLFLPYLHFDSYKRLIRRRDLIAQRLRQGRSQPVPENVAKCDSLELQVVWEYLGHDPPINCRRTLDQYEYPSLRDTRSRDDDQMLYKLTKERTLAVEPNGVFSFRQDSSSGNASGESGESKASSKASSWWERMSERDTSDDGETEDILNGNVLMVDQLWLWVIRSDTIVTFFPKRESDPIEGPLYQQADLRDSIFNEANVDLTRQCENAMDLAAMAALHAVSVLLDRSSHPELEVFRIFEEAISLLTERLTASLKEFRAIGFRDKASDYEAAQDGERSIRKRHTEEGRRAERDNRDNTSALLELRDIEDELQTLLHLFDRQSKVILSMHSIFSRPDLQPQTINARAFLDEALNRIRDYAEQASEMMQRVRTTRDDYDKLLQMVQRQAQVDEVRLSRLHADLASAQSRSVMIFTTFTVIFLPLSFFTGLFGMNTQEWGGDNNLSLRTIGMIALPASAVLVVASLVIAFSSSARRFFRWVASKYRLVERWIDLVIWAPTTALLRGLGYFLMLRRREGRDDGGDRDGGRRRKRLNPEVSDFWERNRPERDSGYRIPGANRKRGLRDKEKGKTVTRK